MMHLEESAAEKARTIGVVKDDTGPFGFVVLCRVVHKVVVESGEGVFPNLFGGHTLLIDRNRTILARQVTDFAIVKFATTVDLGVAHVLPGGSVDFIAQALVAGLRGRTTGKVGVVMVSGNRQGTFLGRVTHIGVHVCPLVVNVVANDFGLCELVDVFELGGPAHGALIFGDYNLETSVPAQLGALRGNGESVVGK